jgi:ABC-type transporter Mla MlaB component
VLRITLHCADPPEAELRLEGQIVGDWATLLERVCNELLDRFAGVVLDLGDVSYVDDAGARVLASLPPDRARFRNGSPLLYELVSDRRSKWTVRH